MNEDANHFVEENDLEWPHAEENDPGSLHEEENDSDLFDQTQVHDLFPLFVLSASFPLPQEQRQQQHVAFLFLVSAVLVPSFPNDSQQLQTTIPLPICVYIFPFGYRIRHCIQDMPNFPMHYR